MFIYQKFSSSFFDFFFLFLNLSFPQFKKFPVNSVFSSFLIPFFNKKKFQSLPIFFMLIYFFFFSCFPDFRILKKKKLFFTGQSHFKILFFKRYQKKRNILQFLDFLFFFFFFNIKTLQKFKIVFYLKKTIITFFVFNSDVFPMVQELKFSTRILKNIFQRKFFFKFSFSLESKFLSFISLNNLFFSNFKNFIYET